MSRANKATNGTSGDTNGTTHDSTDSALDFEQAFGSLQEAIGQLERGGLTLEAAIQTFEQGMALANRCAEILDAAELRITRVVDSSRVELDEPAF
jgi:exodeoxyribonuclease VII small subunit